MATFPNNTSGTAATITSLPTTLVGDFGGVSGEYWSVYQTTADQRYLSFHVTSSVGADLPRCTIFLHDATTVPDPGLATPNQTIQQPVTPSTSYFFRIQPVSLSATITVTITGCPEDAPVGGDLVVPDDEFGFPTLIFDPTSGAVRCAVDFPAGEFADTLPDGTILTEVFNAADQTEHLGIYNGSLTQTALIANPAGSHLVIISGDQVDQFYVCRWKSGAATTLYRVSSAGVLSGTTWAFSAASVATMGVNATGTIAYYSGEPANSAIKRYDLTNSIALTDLVAGVATWLTDELMVLSNGNVIAAYTKSTADFVRNYTSAGATVATYTIPATELFNHLCRATDDPTSVWLWTQSPYVAPHTVSTFRKLATATMTVTSSFSLDIFEIGVSEVIGTTQDFGPSSSCPFFILAVTPPAPEDPRVIRCVRRFQLPFETNLMMFVSRLEIFLESGVGLATGQGDDPILMLRISRDGGHSWGNAMQMGMGAMGQYKHRAYLNRLGRGRDLVCEIVCTDPVKLNLLAAFVDAEAGSS